MTIKSIQSDIDAAADAPGGRRHGDDLHDLVCLVEKGGNVNEWEGGYQPLLRALDPNNDKMGRGCQAEVVA